MNHRVVSTKITEEEHTKLLEFCNEKGITPFEMVKKSIFKEMESPKTTSEILPNTFKKRDLARALQELDKKLRKS